MIVHIDWEPLKDCIQMKEEPFYGMCRKCNKCGRFDKKDKEESNVLSNKKKDEI